MLLAHTRRACAKRGARARKQRALTNPLQAVLATCDDTLHGKRDRALLLFAWATGGRRRCEVASATLENLQRMGGDSAMLLPLHARALQDQPGRRRAPGGRETPGGQRGARMQAWLAASGIQEGALFRRIRKGDI